MASLTHRMLIHSDGSLDVAQAGALGHYRILHDFERADRDYQSRTAAPDWKGRFSTPETVRLNADDGHSSVTLTDAQIKAVENLNPNLMSYIRSLQSGWVNAGPWPRVEVLTFPNLVDVIRIDGSKYYIRTWNGETNDPCVIHRWWNVDADNNLFDAHNGIPGFIILAYKNVWIDGNLLIKV